MKSFPSISHCTLAILGVFAAVFCLDKWRQPPPQKPPLSPLLAASPASPLPALLAASPAEPPPPSPVTPVTPARSGFTSKGAPADSVLVFNEINYHPRERGEWVELRSLQGVDVDISGWRLEGDIAYKFPAGTVARGRGGYVLVAAEPSLPALAGKGALGPFSGKLDNGSGEIRLVNNSGRVMDRVSYSAKGAWPAGPDGSGATLAKKNEESAEAAPGNWTTSATIGGTPGAANFSPGAAHPRSRLIFNEIAPAGEPEFRVELLNVGGVELAAFKIVSSAGPSFALPGQKIAPGAVVTVSAKQLGFTPAKGDRLFILSADGEKFEDGRAVTNRLRGRTTTGRWGFPSAPSFGSAENAFAVNTDVVINEIMYHPHAAHVAKERWIELYNRGTNPAQLGGWALSEGVEFTFPKGTILGPGQYLVVTDQPEGFAQHYPSATAVGPFTGKLAKSGERVALSDAQGNVVDEVAYFDGGRWPELADGGGSSLERRSPFADGTAPENWAASNESARGKWETVSYTGSAENAGSDPTNWNEFVFGLLDGGSFLIDDISVKEKTGGARELIQNGTPAAGAAAPIWRFLGTHRRATVVPDPDGGGHVLRIDASGGTEHLSNHVETTLKSGGAYVPIDPAATYTISFRARWVAGCNLLHTRLYFNRLARKTALFVPPTGGTPGAQNSAFVANLGPTYRHLTHIPAVPAVGETATVSVVPTDANGLGALTLHYAVNGAPFVSAKMSDPDRDGVFSGTIPAQGTGAKVQFYVEAQDAQGASSFFPAAGPASRAIIPWADGQAGPGPAQNLRIVMLPEEVAALHAPANVLSNDAVGTTVIDRERQIYYDVGVWLKGSERGRGQDIRVGFNLRFAAEAPFLGAHRRIAVDRSGAGEEFGQREILVNHGVGRAGQIPGSYADLIHVIAPDAQHTSPAMLFKARFSDEFLENQYVQGSNGGLFEYEMIYVPLTTNISPAKGPHWVEGFKVPFPAPDAIRGERVRDLGTNPELYRWHYLIKNNRQRDDYAMLISAVRTVGLEAGEQFLEEARAKLDVDQWLRTFAVAALFGIGDSYLNGGLAHNAMFYVRPSDGKTLLFPWDMDFTFSHGTNASLTLSPDLRKLIADPGYQRAYYGHVLDILKTTFSSAYLAPWAQHYDQFLPGQNLPRFLGYISARADFARGQIARAIPKVPFAITTPGGRSVGAARATVEGTGWVDVREIRLAGGAEPLAATWLTPSTFRVSVPLAPGANTVTLQALGFDGAVLSTSAISITSTASK